MNKADRYIAQEILGSQATLLVHACHEMYLVAHKREAGLSPKERAWIEARRKAIEGEREKLTKLVERLRKT